MFGKNPSKSDHSSANSQVYAHVTQFISRNEWGQVRFCGRYYQAELHDPSDVELPIGVRVRVYGERDGSLLVGLDTSFPPYPVAMHPPRSQEPPQSQEIIAAVSPAPS
jgi:hypothetical protein